MYPELLKHRAIVHYKYFLKSLRRVSNIYNISKSTLSRWLRNEGTNVQRKQRVSIVQTLKDFVSNKLVDNPFLTTYELSKLVKQELNKSVSKSTIWKTIRASNLSYKRSKPYVYKPTIAKLEQSFIKEYKDDVVSIDETFFYLYDYPKYGYSLKGTKLRRPYAHTPRKKKITLYMAITKDQIIGYKVTTKHGNSNDFVDFVKSLQLTNVTLLMDNVAFHKSKLLKEYVNSIKSKILYTPPYSPQYNPIELAFSKIKTTYRKLNFVNDDMDANILSSITSVTSLDLHSFYKHVQKILDSTPLQS